MQIAFGDKFDYDREGLLIVTAGMGFYLVAVTLNQAALAQGQVRRAAVCWVGCAPAFIVWTLLPVLDDSAASRSGSPRGGAALRAALSALPPPSRGRARGRPSQPRLPGGARGAAGGQPTNEPADELPLFGMGGFAIRCRRGRGVRLPEHRRAGDEQARAGIGNRADRFGVDSAVDLDRRAGASPAAARPSRARGDERLAAPARVDGHAQEQVGGPRELLGRRGRGPGFSAMPARQPASRIAARVRLRGGRLHVES